jgi:DNA repair photolyase
VNHRLTNPTVAISAIKVEIIIKIQKISQVITLTPFYFYTINIIFLCPKNKKYCYVNNYIAVF